MASFSIVRSAWNLPPGMVPGDESPPEPYWYGLSATDVCEAADAEKLDRAMREAILEDAYAPGLTDGQAEELSVGGYYSPDTVELDWDSARLEFRLAKSTTITEAPEKFSVTIRNPFVD